MVTLKLLAAGALLSGIISCVHVPKEAPELSGELAGRMQTVKAAHLQAVRLYMAGKRADVDRFIEQEWLPVFAKNALESQGIQRAVQQMCKGDNAAERVELLVGLGTRLQAQLNRKRTELMRPLDEFERGLVQELEVTYNEMTAMNATLTGLLQAHADTTKTQTEILQKLHVTDHIASTLDDADKIVGLLTSGRDAFERNRDKIDEILKSVTPK